MGGKIYYSCADVAQLVERHFRKVDVPGSIPGIGSKTSDLGAE